MDIKAEPKPLPLTALCFVCVCVCAFYVQLSPHLHTDCILCLLCVWPAQTALSAARLALVKTRLSTLIVLFCILEKAQALCL